MPQKRTHAALMMVVFAGILGGCSTSDRGFVQREWSTTFNELGITPTFPPREDFVVGDVFAYDFDPESAKTQKIFEKKYKDLTPEEQGLRQAMGVSPRLLRINLLTELQTEYASTYALPATVTGGGALVNREGLKDLIADLTKEIEARVKTIADADADVSAAQASVEALGKQTPKTDAEKEKLAKDLAEAQGKLAKAKGKLALLKELNAETKKRKQAVEDQLASAMTMLQPAEEFSVFNLSDQTLPAPQGASKDPKKPKKDAKKPTQEAPDTKEDAPQADQEKTKVKLKPEAARVNRARVVGFPEFSTTSFTSGNLSALVPVEAFLVGGNISYNSVRRVDVKVPAAESVSLSQSTVMNRIYPNNGFSSEMSTALKNAVRGRRGSDGKKLKELWVRVPTEVYYARALDVSIFAARAGARLDVTAPMPDTGGKLPAASEAVNNGTEIDPGTATGSDLYKAAQSQLGRSRSLPGGSVQVVSVSESAVGVRRIYDRPIAIGFRGVTLHVKFVKDEPTLVGISTTSGTNPTFVGNVVN